MQTKKRDDVSYRNSFLLATPAMRDPRFSFSVIYIVSHDKSGAMGIIINKGKTELVDLFCIVRIISNPRAR